MSLLAGANTATNAEKETDRLGGFQLLDTDAYKMTIDTCYLHVGQSNSRNLVVNLKSDKGTFRTMQCFVSGDGSGNKTYYEKDGKQFNLPGFVHVDNLLKLLGTTLDTVTIEDKVIKLYNHEAKGEVNTPVKMLTDLLGKSIGVCIQKQTVDKTTKGDDGKYHPTGETRDENDLVKFFNPDNGMTALEIEAEGVTEPAFVPAWVEKNKGKVYNKAKGNGSQAGAPAQQAAAPTAPIFSN